MEASRPPVLSSGSLYSPPPPNAFSTQGQVLQDHGPQDSQIHSTRTADMKISLCRTGFEDTGYVMKEWLNTEKRWRLSGKACSPVLTLLGVLYMCHRWGDWGPR